MKINLRKLLGSLTGISTPLVGVSWNPPPSECEIVRKLVTFLEDKRSICGPYDFWSGPRFEYFVTAVLAIRNELTKAIQALPEDSRAIHSLRAMRGTCRKFLTDPMVSSRDALYGARQNEAAVLGEFRGAFGVHLSELCSAFDLEIEEQFVVILPAPDHEEEINKFLKIRDKHLLEWHRNNYAQKE